MFPKIIKNQSGRTWALTENFPGDTLKTTIYINKFLFHFFPQVNYSIEYYINTRTQTECI